VVPAEQRAKHRGEDAEQGAVGEHPPVEADVDAALVGRQRPHALAGQVADHLDLELAGALHADDLGACLEVVGEPALELLLGDGAELGSAVAVDLEVHRRPPLRVRVGVGERLEHGGSCCEAAVASDQCRIRRPSFVIGIEAVIRGR
jgi:hypothetical protein